MLAVHPQVIEPKEPEYLDVGRVAVHVCERTDRGLAGANQLLECAVLD